MNDVMGIINLIESEDSLNGLTRHRPISAVPFASRYRLIDFVLSNMVNSGMKNIAILTQNKHRALIDHLRSGKEWDLDRKRDGLFIFPPDNIRCESGADKKGNLQNFYNNLDYIHKSRQKYVLVSCSNIVCNIDYRRALDYHLKSNADITLLYKEVKDDNRRDFSDSTRVTVADDGRVIDMEVKPGKINSNKVSLDMYIMEKSILIDLIDACFSRGYYDLVKDGFVKNISMLRVFAYPYQGYCARINTVESYYRNSMDLLKPEVWNKLFFKPGPIYTKIKDGAPAKYTDGSRVKNCLVANGCVVEGIVENSILFRGVKIRKGAYVKDSIIMQKTEIGENAVIKNVISDKEVFISAGKQLTGDKNYPVLIEKKSII